MPPVDEFTPLPYEFATLGGVTHRRAQSELIAAGWNVCGVGDWAVTLRSPDGVHAARICPFDPAYPVFVQLCRRLPDHPFLPRIHVDVALDGGGQLTVMEFLVEAPAEAAAEAKRQWDAREGGIAVVRREAEALNTEAAAGITWWDGIDLNRGNILTSLSGQVKLVDVFCMDGESIYQTLLTEPATLAARLPEPQRRHMAEISYIARTSTPAEIEAIKQAVAAAS